jgi:hypothetical protein
VPNTIADAFKPTEIINYSEGKTRHWKSICVKHNCGRIQTNRNNHNSIQRKIAS